MQQEEYTTLICNVRKKTIFQHNWTYLIYTYKNYIYHHQHSTEKNSGATRPADGPKVGNVQLKPRQLTILKSTGRAVEPECTHIYICVCVIFNTTEAELH